MTEVRRNRFFNVNEFLTPREENSNISPLEASVSGRRMMEELSLRVGSPPVSAPPTGTKTFAMFCRTGGDALDSSTADDSEYPACEGLVPKKQRKKSFLKHARSLSCSLGQFRNFESCCCVPEIHRPFSKKNLTVHQSENSRNCETPKRRERCSSTDGVQGEQGELQGVSMLSLSLPRTAPGTPAVDVREGRRVFDSPGPICRICHDGYGLLISPCLCSGSMALIHKACLERWLTTTSSSSCELCHHRYRVASRPLPFFRIFCDTAHADLRRLVLTDLVCFLVLTPLSLAAVSLCLVGAMQVNQDIELDAGKNLANGVSKQPGDSRLWEAGWLVLLAVVLLMVYLIWFCFTIISVNKNWNMWREENQRVKLLDSDQPARAAARGGVATVSAPCRPLRLVMDTPDTVSSPLGEGAQLHLMIDTPEIPASAGVGGSLDSFSSPSNVRDVRPPAEPEGRTFRSPTGSVIAAPNHSSVQLASFESSMSLGL